MDTLFGELCTCSWCLVRHEQNNFCRMYFGSWKGRFLLCCKLQCVCLFSATFQTTLCRYILFCELVHAWDNCSKDTVSPNNISRRWLWQQEKRRRDKRRREVERRETLWASLRASHNEPRTRTHILCEPASRFHKSPFMQKITFKKKRAPEWAQNADTHFVRAGAVKTHVKISQEPLNTEIYR